MASLDLIVYMYIGLKLFDVAQMVKTFYHTFTVYRSRNVTPVSERFHDIALWWGRRRLRVM